MNINNRSTKEGLKMDLISRTTPRDKDSVAKKYMTFITGIRLCVTYLSAIFLAAKIQS